MGEQETEAVTGKETKSIIAVDYHPSSSQDGGLHGACGQHLIPAVTKIDGIHGALFLVQVHSR